MFSKIYFILYFIVYVSVIYRCNPQKVNIREYNNRCYNRFNRVTTFYGDDFVPHEENALTRINLTGVNLFVLVELNVTYLEIQQPVVTFVNENHVKNLTVVSKRFGRNPLYFMTVSGTTVVTFDETTELHFYAYEKFPDGFKRSFVENHVNLCDFINEKNLFSKVFLPGRVSDILECPVLPNDYFVPNVTAPYGFYLNALPFTEGRLYLNVTYRITNRMVSAWANINIKKMKKSLFLKYIKEIQP